MRAWVQGKLECLKMYVLIYTFKKYVLIHTFKKYVLIYTFKMYAFEK